MRKAHALLITMWFALCAGIAAGGYIILTGPDEVTQSCSTAHSTSWGILLIFIALVMAAPGFVAAWDAS